MHTDRYINYWKDNHDINMYHISECCKSSVHILEKEFSEERLGIFACDKCNEYCHVLSVTEFSTNSHIIAPRWLLKTNEQIQEADDCEIDFDWRRKIDSIIHNNELFKGKACMVASKDKSKL